MPNFNTEIVGESNYKTNISKCYQNGQFTDVILKLENDNAYDKNAVAVVSKHGTVGYLSRETAVKYRKDYNNSDGRKVKAKIYPPPEGGNHYGIWVDLDSVVSNSEPNNNILNNIKKIFSRK